jgi:hypothetical protein
LHAVYLLPLVLAQVVVAVLLSVLLLLLLDVVVAHALLLRPCHLLLAAGELAGVTVTLLTC